MCRSNWIDYVHNRSFAYPKDPSGRSPNVAVRQGDWKLLVNADGTNPQLYNVRADAGETLDVFQANAEIGARLKEQVLNWRRSMP